MHRNVLAGRDPEAQWLDLGPARGVAHESDLRHGRRCPDVTLAQEVLCRSEPIYMNRRETYMIIKSIKEIIAEVKETPELMHTLTDDADIIQDVGLDSLQMMAFLLRIEETLGVRFDCECFDFSHLQSISALAAR